MSNKLTPYLKHLKSFMETLKLSHDNILVGVSGGVDSMVLLHLLKKLNYKLRAVHINHNTRPEENQSEQELVETFCKKNNIPLEVHQYKHTSGNFEMRARDFRYKLFNKKQEKPNYIATAYHIDDSFEWHLMQKFKSGSRNNLGIPVRNKNIIRPLMCFTKTQVYNLAKLLNTPYLEDSSNTSLDYERNYVRNIIVPHIKKKYPKYLKHYVNQMNNRAKELGIHISSENQCYDNKNTTTNEIKLPLNSCYYDVEKAIKKMSSKKRGKISNNLNALLKTIEKGKRNFHMLFSGKVVVEVSKIDIIIYNSSNSKKANLLV